MEPTAGGRCRSLDIGHGPSATGRCATPTRQGRESNGDAESPCSRNGASMRRLVIGGCTRPARDLPDVGRVVDGLSLELDLARRVDRLRGLGNAIVPQLAEWLGRRDQGANDREGAEERIELPYGEDHRDPTPSAALKDLHAIRARRSSAAPRSSTAPLASKSTSACAVPGISGGRGARQERSQECLNNPADGMYAAFKNGSSSGAFLSRTRVVCCGQNRRGMVTGGSGSPRPRPDRSGQCSFIGWPMNSPTGLSPTGSNLIICVECAHVSIRSTWSRLHSGSTSCAEWVTAPRLPGAPCAHAVTPTTCSNRTDPAGVGRVHGHGTEPGSRALGKRDKPMAEQATAKQELILTLEEMARIVGVIARPAEPPPGADARARGSCAGGRPTRGQRGAARAEGEGDGMITGSPARCISATVSTWRWSTAG